MDAQISELQLTLQLGRLTQQHAPLVAALLKRGSNGQQLQSLGELAGMQEDDWLALVRQPGVGIPKSADHGSGNKEAENYVQGIMQLLAAAFPTAVVAAEMKRANRPEDNDALRFFANCPDFELGTTRIDDFLASHGEQAFAGVNDKKALLQQLKSMQRVFNVSPNYQHMQALLDQAKRDLDHTVLRAPIAGIATQVASIQMGRYVSAGTPVFSLVDDAKPWIDANPKETDITHLRVGQPVAISVDTFPGRTFRGQVAAVSPGTGAQFAILPPQNASGNWVKVVQRVPVRIEFTNGEDVRDLRAGMSVTVDIDTGRHNTVWSSLGLSSKAAEQRK